MVVFGVLMLNIFFIGIDAGTSEASQTANTKSISLSYSRGMIYDRNMCKMVNNQLEILTVVLPDNEALSKINSYITFEQKTELYDNLANGKVSVIKTDAVINEQTVKSVYSANRYSHDQLCAHIIGHLDNNGDGVLGIEKIYNNYLSQQAGELKAKWNVNALGHILYGEGISFESDNYLSPAGIQLTIDLRIQKIVEDVLREYNIGNGAAVVMNSETGELLASASVPTFDPNNLGNAVLNSDSPFINRAFTPYSVGSVFKPIVAATALENNTDLTYECTGTITVGGKAFSCNNETAHGLVNMKTAMEQSCNCYFIALGQLAEEENLLSMCKNMGLGKSVELADNYFIKSGTLPTQEELSSPPSLANFSFGQGTFSASPIQMASAYSVFANGGYYREPTLMKGIVDSNGDIIQKVALPQKKQVLSSGTVAEINEILQSVITNGNGHRAYSEMCVGYGKTATAQSGWYQDDREITHTWFCGYFEINDIKFTAVILKEDGNSGAQDCAPIFKTLSEKIVTINWK